MEIKFADTFAKSLKAVIRHQTWWYKLYSLVRYDIPRFINNVWIFRKSLAQTYVWDHHGPMLHLEIALTRMADYIEKDGLEVDESRLKKVSQMRRAAELIRNYNEDNYIDLAEAELGGLILHDWEFEDVPDRPGYSQLVDKDTPEEKEHNSKVFNRAREIEEAQWKELWSILKGQDFSLFNKETDWHSQFDGSGLRGWWD